MRVLDTLFYIHLSLVRVNVLQNISFERTIIGFTLRKTRTRIPRKRLRYYFYYYRYCYLYVVIIYRGGIISNLFLQYYCKGF